MPTQCGSVGREAVGAARRRGRGTVNHESSQCLGDLGKEKEYARIRILLDLVLDQTRSEVLDLVRLHVQLYLPVHPTCRYSCTTFGTIR